MELREAIEEILGKFGAGDVFDSHTVIEFLRVNYGNIYYRGAGTYTIENIGLYHGQLSRMIRDSGLVEEVQNVGEVRTININGNISANHLWRKR